MLSHQEVLDLQAECFADDIPIPPGAASWGEERLRAYFESGGAEESVCGDLDSARSSIDAATVRDDPGAPPAVSLRHARLPSWADGAGPVRL